MTNSGWPTIGDRVTTTHGSGVLVAIDNDEFGYPRYYRVQLDKGFTVSVTQLNKA